MDYIDSVSGGRFEYDVRLFDYDWNPIEDEVNSFLNDATNVESLYKALHINNSTKKPYYSPSSDEVAKAYDEEALLDYTRMYIDLI